MVLSMYMFSLACGHQVVLGRLNKADIWSCEDCGKAIDLRIESYRTEFERAWDTANQADKHARQRGQTVIHADR